MKTTNIYANLRAEMARLGIGVQDIATVIGVDRSTARRKLSGRGEFTLTEVRTISDTLFSGMSLRYLFTPEKD